MSPQACVYHRCESFLAQRTRGEVLWAVKPYQTMKLIKQACAMLKVENAEALSWKSFRAGKASAMANKGDSLGKILQYGEWSSTALLNYIDENCIGEARALESGLISSGEE